MAKRGHSHAGRRSAYRRCADERCGHEAKYHMGGRCIVAGCPDHLWREPMVSKSTHCEVTWVEAPMFDIDALAPYQERSLFDAWDSMQYR